MKTLLKMLVFVVFASLASCAVTEKTSEPISQSATSKAQTTENKTLVEQKKSRWKRNKNTVSLPT